MVRIDSGIKNAPIKCVIYGPEGIGKSTLAALLPDPLIYDLEGGTNQMDVRRISKPTDWSEFLATIREIAVTPGICKTLVIDTADKAEQLCIDYVCRRFRQTGIEGFGYGKGYAYTAEEWLHFMEACDDVIAAGMNVVIIAHAKMRKFEQPDEMGAYDRWELKLTKSVAPLVKEWADMVLFANYKTYVVSSTNNGAKKAQGGKRVMYANHHPCWDAKNRFGLPDEMDLDYDNIRRIFERADTPTNACTNEPTPLERLRSMMVDASISDEEIKGFVTGQGYAQPEQPVDTYPDDLIYWIITNWTEITNHLRTK